MSAEKKESSAPDQDDRTPDLSHDTHVTPDQATSGPRDMLPVAGEVEQHKATGEVEQQKATGEVEQHKVTSEVELQKAAAAGDAAAAATEAGPVRATRRERKIVEYGGFRFFQFERVSVSTEQHLRNLKAMPLRADDILIAAFPKCGTHWVWEVVHMLTSGQAEYETRTKEHLMLEFHDVDKFRDMPSPRILNTHLFLSVLSEEMATQRPKIVHVMRNPKDVAVSQYFHRRQWEHFEDQGILSFVEEFLDGGDLPGGCFSDYLVYLQKMQRWQAQNLVVPVINLYFEDIKRAPVECTQRLAAFLELPVTEEFCRQVADACTFHNLKAADKSKKYPTETHQASDTEAATARGLKLPAPLQGESTINLSQMSEKSKPKKIDIYRKGEIGDWKNYLTVALSEKFDTIIAQNWKDCDFAKQFIYEM